MFSISLKNNIHFLCASEDTILVGAQKGTIALDHSCKTGRCQSCKAKVIDGTSIATIDEVGLSDQDKLKGYILTCIRKPTSDLMLDVEDLNAYALEHVRTIPSKVDKITVVTPDVIELQLRLPPQANFKYLSGQYINIIKGDYRRSYSIACSNSNQNLVFYIRNYEGGKFSQYLFKEAKINDLLRIEGPIGTFFYRETSKKNIVFLATGTGIAPVKAMLEQMDENHSEVINKIIYLFFGGRTEKDLFWEPKFTNVNVVFVPVLSRSDDKWNGAKGYVQDVVLSNDIDLKDSVFYACGSENMIKDSRELVLNKGVSEDAFYSDAFISS